MGEHWLQKLSRKFRKEYDSQLLPHADWAIKMFVRYALAYRDGCSAAVKKVDEEMEDVRG